MLSEGERGLLGVGYTPARVLASVDADGRRRRGAATRRRRERARGARARACSTHVTAALGVRCRIEVAEDDDALTATCSGDELGLLIGKHGADDRRGPGARERDRRPRRRASGRNVVVDAAGYRDRRRRTLEALAVRSAEEALRDGRRASSSSR